MPKTVLPGPLVALVSVLCAGAPLLAQSTIDPFAAGPRWQHAADFAAPWMARDVVLGFGDELVIAGLSQGQPQLALFGAQHEPDGALLVADDKSWTGAQGVLSVAATEQAAYCLAGLPDPNGTRLRLARYGAAIPADPIWSVDLASVGASSNRLVAAPGRVVVAQSITNPVRVRLTGLGAALGATLFEVELPGGTLRAMDISDGGERVLVLAGSETYIVDGASGAVEFHQHDDDPMRSAALAGDGLTLALGSASSIEILTSAGPGAPMLPALALAGGALEYPVAMDLSRDGSTLAAGWWDASTGQSIRLETWDLTAQPVRVNHLVQGGPPSGPQNYISDISLSADGQRAAFGLWGTGGSEPEVVLFDLKQAAPILAESLQGSVYAVDLSADGTRLAVGRKQGHANIFGSLGAVELLDTGERDLELSSSARVGTSIDVWLASPGGQSATLLIGAPLMLPTPIAGLVGDLGVDPSLPWALIPAAPAGAGRFTVPLHVPPAAAGLDFALQGIFLATGAAGLEARVSVHVAHPPVL